jgi:hypothetical protein
VQLTKYVDLQSLALSSSTYLTPFQAFQSRLHVTLGLSPLSVKDRRDIWYNFIKDLKELSKDHRRALAHEAKENWCHADLNGRQIRNCVKTALVLARQDNAPVGVKHFQTVIDIGMHIHIYTSIYLSIYLLLLLSIPMEEVSSSQISFQERISRRTCGG